MYIVRKNGSTSNVDRVMLRSSATGQGLTGLTHSSSGLVISTIASNESTATAYTSVASTIETITTLGTFAAPTSTKCRFKEVDATNHPGLYELQFSDARFSVSNAKTLRVTISGATNLLAKDIVFQLTASDVVDVANPSVNLETIKTQSVTCSGGVTIPAATLASTTNITAGTLTTVTTVTNAPSDSSGTTTLLSRLSTTRAGYLDFLNVGGNVATQSDVNAINQSASRRVVLQTSGQWERPDSGTSSYQVELRTYDGDGAATNADSNPTLTATGIVSGSLAANLGSISNPATGVYRWTYSVSSSATLEQVRLDASATISSSSFSISAYPQVCDFVAANWSATDRSQLQAIYGKLPSSAYFAGTSTADGSGALVDTGVDADGFDLSEVLRLCLATLAGKISGLPGTTVTIRAADDSKDRIVATIDGDHNRTALTLDATP